jgi:uncharacterized protein YqhQ
MENEIKKETNLAYGGQAIIEGIMMRSKDSYAVTIKKPNGDYYKEKVDYVALGKRVKILGIPFVRGIVGFIENMFFGMKILNKSAAIAFPEEGEEKVSNLALFFTFLLAMLIAMVIFVGIPRFLPMIFKLDPNVSPFIYNTVSAISRFVIFFLYLIMISFMSDTKRLFGYHGAEHKTIHTYEAEEDLTVENVKKHSRLHPRCGTAFLFIVLLITIVVFPFFDVALIRTNWYSSMQVLPEKIAETDFNNNYISKIDNRKQSVFYVIKYMDKNLNLKDKQIFQSAYVKNTDNIYVLNQNISFKEKSKLKSILISIGYNKFAQILQNIIIILMHMLIGMPIVASISYELLKLSGKYYKNFLVKILVSPGMFFQLFTTNEPDENMIKVGIISLSMVTGKEDVGVARSANDELIIDSYKPAFVTSILLIPVMLFNMVFNQEE